jgi:hypothetical protein
MKSNRAIPTVKSVEASKIRQLETPKYRSFVLQKRIKHIGPLLPTPWRLTANTIKFFKKNFRGFMFILVIFAVCNFMLVRLGNEGLNLVGYRDSLRKIVGGEVDSTSEVLGLYSFLVGSIGQTSSESSAIYQTQLIVIFSLVMIWFIRERSAGNNTHAKMALYNGPRALFQAMYITIIMFLQLIPFRVGNAIYGVVLSEGLSTDNVQNFGWMLIFGATGLISFYMICSSLFALYIVTLPNMLPTAALKTSRGLVRYRRMAVGIRVAALPFLLMIPASVLLLPALAYAPQYAEVMFFLMSMISLAFIHTYLYQLYRALLKS